MKILIYGAGALGQALGCLLAQAGHKVDLIVRKRFMEVLSLKGVVIDGVLGDFRVKPGIIGLYDVLDDVEDIYDYVLITTKSYDTKNAVNDLLRIHEKIGTVVSMQNGCGNLEIIEDSFGSKRTLGARIITGFEIKEEGVIHISVTADRIHIGGCQRGTIPQEAEMLAKALTESGHPSLAVKDIYQALHAKLLYNCALNPLGALLQTHYGALAENDQTCIIMNRVIDETFHVIRALEGTLPWTSAQEYREVFYSTLVPATFNHRASMLQDLENGKPTEVDSLVGYVSKKGKETGVDTTTCDLLAGMIKFKESSGDGIR